MTKSYHVNLETGETSECSAEIRCCLNGIDNEPHFATARAAQKAFENRMEPETFKKLSKGALPENSSGPFISDIGEAMKQQSFVPGNNSKPAQTYMQDMISGESSNKPFIFYGSHGAGKTAEMDDLKNSLNNENIAKLAANPFEESKLYKPLLNDLTDDQADVVLNNAGSLSALNRIVLASPNPNISLPTKIKALKTSACFQLKEKVVKSDGFPAKKLVPHMSLVQRKATAEWTTDPEAVDEIVKELEVNRGVFLGVQGDIADAAFKNPTTSFKTKRELVRLRPSLNSLMRVQESMQSSPRKFEGLIKSKDNSESSATGTDKIVFDTAKVRDLGWSPREVTSYVSNVLNMDSLGGTYDADTGVYTIFRD